MCVLIFSTIFVWNISRSIKIWATQIKIIHWYLRKVPDITVRF
jgi:hypothetical protein